MIIYSLIVRTFDGMALTANTDFNDEANMEIRDNKRYVKLLAKKTAQFSDRCTLTLGAFVIHFISGAGLSFLALCSASYPPVLAFSFLSELQREFLIKYEPGVVTRARRPFSFIEFDSVIHAARQRYNKPQSLSTRIDLSRLSEEIRLRPPILLDRSLVEPVNGMLSGGPSLARLSVGPRARLEPITWPAVVVATLSFGLAGIGAYRGISTLSNIDERPGVSTELAMFFLIESTSKVLQLHLLARMTRYRRVESWIALAVCLMCGAILSRLRDTWQVAAYAGSSLWLHVSILRRRLEPSLPNYNI